jgi:hypothetical protein
MSRAQYVLNLIAEMHDPENDKEHSLKGQKTGYRYMDRDQIDGGTNVEYDSGKRPSGYKSKSGHSA